MKKTVAKAKMNMMGNGSGHHVKLGKHSMVKAGPSFEKPAKSDMASDMYANGKAESQY